MIWGILIIFGVLTLLYISIIRWLDALGKETEDE
jgi:hypothetical protein